MRLPVALLALALALSGCSDSGGGDDEPAGGTGFDPSLSASNTTTPAPPPPAPVTHEVTMAGNAFDPAELTINKGDTVHWTHADGTSPHNVESDAPAFDSNPDCTIPIPASPNCMTDGDDFSYTFSEAGVVEYRCQVHSGMTGRLNVIDPTAG